MSKIFTNMGSTMIYKGFSFTKVYFRDEDGEYKIGTLMHDESCGPDSGYRIFEALGLPQVDHIADEIISEFDTLCDNEEIIKTARIAF